MAADGDKLPGIATGSGNRSDGAGTSNRSARRFTNDPYVGPQSKETGARSGRRPSEGNADRYSFFVFIMKFVLPGLALVTLAIALLWPMLNETRKRVSDAAKVEVKPDQIKNFEMLAPKLVGVDENNRPFRIEAKSARQAGPNADQITLVQPKANITLQSGNWVAISAKQGLYSQKRRILQLRGAVNLFHDANYTFKTEEAEINLITRDAKGAKPVSGTAPSGKIRAQGFRVTNRGQNVFFTGKTRVILYVNKGDVDGMLNGTSPAKKAKTPTETNPKPAPETGPAKKTDE